MISDERRETRFEVQGIDIARDPRLRAFRPPLITLWRPP
jgi:hypothetical protein